MSAAAIRADYHCHSRFSDGADTLEEMVQAALSQGMEALGFSEHSYAEFDLACCMPLGQEQVYLSSVRSLAEQYRGKIKLYAGIEQDFYAPPPRAAYDYVIGSVHDLLIDGSYYCVDWKEEFLRQAAQALHGDMLSVAECYFRTVAQVVEKTHCQLIGHFDLVAKLNGRYRLFDETDPRYMAAWQAAAEQLLATGVPFEVNTGAMSRGYRQVAYPAPPILRWLAERGARFVLSSDSHRADTLMYDFPAQQALLAQLGAEPLPCFF